MACLIEDMACLIKDMASTSTMSNITSLLDVSECGGLKQPTQYNLAILNIDYVYLFRNIYFFLTYISFAYKQTQQTFTPAVDGSKSGWRQHVRLIDVDIPYVESNDG